MPKANQQADPNRRQTRPSNANAHPGKVVKEVLGGRRKPEEIEMDKKARQERREEKERKKAKIQESIQQVADFEHTMALHDKVEETSFPRHQTEGKTSDTSLLNTCYGDTHPSKSSNQPTGQKQEA
jgi:hypothetical protein